MVSGAPVNTQDSANWAQKATVVTMCESPGFGPVCTSPGLVLDSFFWAGRGQGVWTRSGFLYLAVFLIPLWSFLKMQTPGLELWLK
jgi:hypothetical protein